MVQLYWIFNRIPLEILVIKIFGILGVSFDADRLCIGVFSRFTRTPVMGERIFMNIDGEKSWKLRGQRREAENVS